MAEARIVKDDRGKWDALAGKLREIKEKDGASSKIGVFAEKGADLVKIAAANEFGATIKRKGTKGGVSFGFRTKKDLEANKIRFLKPGKGVVSLGVTKPSGPFTIKIPERSFLRSAIDENKQVIVKFVDQQAINLIVKQNQSLKRTLGLLGLFGVKLVKEKIVRGPFVPNAPSTIRKKKSSKPLIDKGRLFGSITHKV
jgi:hypothetical protein